MESTSPTDTAPGSLRQDVLLLGCQDLVRSAATGLFEILCQPDLPLLQPYVFPERLLHFGPAWRLPPLYRALPLHMNWFLPVLNQHPSLMLWDLHRQMTDEHDELDWSLASLVVQLPAAGVAQSMHWRHDHRKKTFGNPPRWNTVWDSEESLAHALEHMLMRSVVWHEQVQPWCKQNTLDSAWSSSDLSSAELVRL